MASAVALWFGKVAVGGLGRDACVPVLALPLFRHFLHRPCSGPRNSDTAKPHALDFVVNVLVWQLRYLVRCALHFFQAPGHWELVRELVLVPAGDSSVPFLLPVSACPEEEEMGAVPV